MSLEVRTFCARCNKERRLFRQLCESCMDKVRAKLEKVRRLDYDVRKEMARKYGAEDAEEAWIIQRFGRAREERICRCGRCNRLLSENEAFGDPDAFPLRPSESSNVHFCASCLKKEKRERKKDKERERRKFRRI